MEWDGLKGDGMEWDGMEWDGMGWNGMGWKEFVENQYRWKMVHILKEEMG